MDDDSLPQMHAIDRVSIRAVLALDENGARRAASAAGIHDPVVVPIGFGSNLNVMLGDGFTPNLVAIFEPDETHEPADLDEPSVSLDNAPLHEDRLDEFASTENGPPDSE